MRSLAKRLSIIGLLAAGYQTFWVVLIGLYSTQYDCNWDRAEGVPFFMVGKTAVQKLQPPIVSVAYFFTVFATVAVIGIMIVVLWWLTETPVTGYVCMVILIPLELGAKPYLHIFLGIVNLQPEKIYLQGIDPWQLVSYPVVFTICGLVAGVITIKNHNFLRIN